MPIDHGRGTMVTIGTIAVIAVVAIGGLLLLNWLFF